MKMCENLSDKFNRYRTMNRSRDDLLAVIWVATGMTPNTPILERSKVLQIQLMMMENKANGFPLMPDNVTIDSCVAKAMQQFGRGQPDTMASIVPMPGGQYKLQGRLSALMLPASSTGQPWQVAQTPDGKWFCSDGSQSYLLSDLLEEFKAAPPPPQQAGLEKGSPEVR